VSVLLSLYSQKSKKAAKATKSLTAFEPSALPPAASTSPGLPSAPAVLSGVVSVDENSASLSTNEALMEPATESASTSRKPRHKKNTKSTTADGDEVSLLNGDVPDIPKATPDMVSIPRPAGIPETYVAGEVAIIRNEKNQLVGLVPERFIVNGDELPGIRVKSVKSGSLAEKASLKAGDIISRLQNRDVTDFESALNVIKTYSDCLQMRYWRGERSVHFHLSVTIFSLLEN
jgi:hypothetical protein